MQVLEDNAERLVLRNSNGLWSVLGYALVVFSILHGLLSILFIPVILLLVPGGSLIPFGSLAFFFIGLIVLRIHRRSAIIVVDQRNISVENFSFWIPFHSRKKTIPRADVVDVFVAEIGVSSEELDEISSNLQGLFLPALQLTGGKVFIPGKLYKSVDVAAGIRLIRGRLGLPALSDEELVREVDPANVVTSL